MKSQVLKQKVFVGLSGGVDSSVSATLLKKAGYAVTGVFIKIWSSEWIGCTSKEDRLDAMRVCAHLDIPFREIDLTKEYKKEVVDYMISEYKAGRTPNPDVMCNQKIKFGAFFNWAIKKGTDFVATGHYARIRSQCDANIRMHANDTNKSDNENLNIKNYKLKISKDSNKDQTYFLWTLTQRELSRTLFPIGHLTKPEVRKLAKKFGLPTADKKDSQGLCFVGPVDVKEFLRKYIKPKRGVVLNTESKIIGWHDGAEFLTIGERRGFTITQKTPDDSPCYIIAKDIKKNAITVSQISNLGAEFPSEVVLSEVNWIADQAPDFNKTYFARFRYRQPLQEVSIKYNELSIREEKNPTIIHNSSFVIHFQKPQTAIAPGQSLIVYTKSGECIGGGIIEN